AINSQNIEQIYVIENMVVSLFRVAGQREARGGKWMVSLEMLLKTHGEKMSENRSLAMLMKKSQLKHPSGDVDEKKWS
ncbi:MAG: hypothetical protein ABSF45_21950, partial [Terriglobia bacterium]